MSNILYVVGLGPGKREYMTGQAVSAILEAEIIAGYTAYTGVVKENFTAEELAGKEFFENGMGLEEERVRFALCSAQEGKCTALVCSGDAGVFGMAGLALELSKEYPAAEIKIVSGVTAALSAGAVLGAPLGNDFAVVSLSDYHVPEEMIHKRLRALGELDMCIALYNPGGKRRPESLKRACEVLLSVLPADTVCGVCRNAGREDESTRIMSLSELSDFMPDMFTIVFIGNSNTVVKDGKIVTSRGFL